MLYRKQALVVEARQWTGKADSTLEIVEWIESYSGRAFYSENALFIFTFEGTMQANAGDFIIRGIADEFYPCKPEIFEKSYQPEPDPSFQSGTLDDAYFDRNQVVLLLSYLAADFGWDVWVNNDDPEWPILFIETPAGQLSWHIPAKEMPKGITDWYDLWKDGEKVWDGHTLEEKRARISRLIDEFES